MLLLLATACTAPWTVQTESGPPSALQGHAAFSVRSDFSQVSISGKPEATSPKAGTPEWAEDKSTLAASFYDRLRADSRWTFSEGEGDVEVVARWTWVEPGYYGGAYDVATQTRSYVAFRIGGVTVDEIIVDRSEGFSMARRHSAQRLDVCARATAEAVLAFLARAT